MYGTPVLHHPLVYSLILGPLIEGHDSSAGVMETLSSPNLGMMSTILSL